MNTSFFALIYLVSQFHLAPPQSSFTDSINQGPFPLHEATAAQDALHQQGKASLMCIYPVDPSQDLTRLRSQAKKVVNAAKKEKSFIEWLLKVDGTNWGDLRKQIEVIKETHRESGYTRYSFTLWLEKPYRDLVLLKSDLVEKILELEDVSAVRLGVWDLEMDVEFAKLSKEELDTLWMPEMDMADSELLERADEIEYRGKIAALLKRVYGKQIRRIQQEVQILREVSKQRKRDLSLELDLGKTAVPRLHVRYFLRQLEQTLQSSKNIHLTGVVTSTKGENEKIDWNIVQAVGEESAKYGAKAVARDIEGVTEEPLSLVTHIGSWPVPNGYVIRGIPIPSNHRGGPKTFFKKMTGAAIDPSADSVRRLSLAESWEGTEQKRIVDEINQRIVDGSDQEIDNAIEKFEILELGRKIRIHLKDPLTKVMQKRLFKQPGIIEFEKDTRTKQEKRNILIIDVGKFLERIASFKDPLNHIEGSVGREFVFDLSQGFRIDPADPSNEKKRHMVTDWNREVKLGPNLTVRPNEPIELKPDQRVNLFDLVEELTRREGIATGQVLAKGGDLYYVRFAIYSEENKGYRNVRLVIDREKREIRIDYEDLPNKGTYKSGTAFRYQGKVTSEIAVAGNVKQLVDDQWELYRRKIPVGSRLWYFIRGNRDPARSRAYDPVILEKEDPQGKANLHRHYRDSFPHIHTAFTLRFTDENGNARELPFMGHIWEMVVANSVITVQELAAEQKGKDSLMFVRVDNFKSLDEEVSKLLGISFDDAKFFYGKDVLNNQSQFIPAGNAEEGSIVLPENLALGEPCIYGKDGELSVSGPGAFEKMPGVPLYNEYVIVKQLLKKQGRFYRTIEAAGTNINVEVWHAPNAKQMIFFPDPVDKDVLAQLRKRDDISYMMVRSEAEGLAYLDPYDNARRLIVLGRWINQETPDGVPLILGPFVNGNLKSLEFLEAMPKLRAIFPWSAGTDNSINDEVNQYAKKRGILVAKISSPLTTTVTEYAELLSGDIFYGFSDGKVRQSRDAVPPEPGWVSAVEALKDESPELIAKKIVPFEIGYLISRLRRVDEIRHKVRQSLEDFENKSIEEKLWGQAPNGTKLGMSGLGTIGQEVGSNPGLKLGLVGMGAVNRHLLEVLLAMGSSHEIQFFLLPGEEWSKEDQVRLRELKALLKKIAPEVKVRYRRVRSLKNLKKNDYLFIDPEARNRGFDLPISQLETELGEGVIDPTRLFVKDPQQLQHPFLGKTLGVFGFGKLGERATRLLIASLGMRPIAYQRDFERVEDGKKLFQEKKKLIDELAEFFIPGYPQEGLQFYWDPPLSEPAEETQEQKKLFFQTADLVLVTADLNRESEGFIDEQAVQWFLEGKRDQHKMMLNISRGKIVAPGKKNPTESWLLDYLEKFPLFFFVTDVMRFEQYPTAEVLPLLRHSRFYFYLHHASHVESTRRGMVQTMINENVNPFLKGEVPKGTQNPLQVGLKGFGNVGHWVEKVFKTDWVGQESMKIIGIPMKISIIQDSDPQKRVDVEPGRFTTNPDELLAGLKKPDVLIEVTSGLWAEKEVLKAIENGDIVITSNKWLWAEKLKEFFEAAQKSGSLIGLEAAMGGECDETAMIEKMREEGKMIQSIYAIANGTTNKMLTDMEHAIGQSKALPDMGVLFNSVLEDAIKQHFAEPDHSKDTLGEDAGYKLLLLAAIAGRLHYTPGSFPVEGIVKKGSWPKEGFVFKDREGEIYTSLITPEDFAAVKELGYKIRLVARLVRTHDDDDELDIRVHLALVPENHPIAQTEGIRNIFLIRDSDGNTLFSEGEGAGEKTADAIARDAIRVFQKKQQGVRVDYTLREGKVFPIEKTRQRYYLHVEAANRSIAQAMQEIDPEGKYARQLGQPDRLQAVTKAYWITPQIQEREMDMILNELNQHPQLKVRRIRVFEGYSVIEETPDDQYHSRLTSSL